MRKEWRDLLDDAYNREVRLIISRMDISLRLATWRLGLPKEYQWPQQKILMRMLVQEKWRKTKITEVQETAEECIRRCEKEKGIIVAVRFDDTLLVDEAHLYD